MRTRTIKKRKGKSSLKKRVKAKRIVTPASIKAELRGSAGREKTIAPRMIDRMEVEQIVREQGFGWIEKEVKLIFGSEVCHRVDSRLHQHREVMIESFGLMPLTEIVRLLKTIETAKRVVRRLTVKRRKKK